MKKGIVVLLVAMVVLSACGKKEQDHAAHGAADGGAHDPPRRN